MLKGIQNLSDSKKKIILWGVMILVCALLLVWFWRSAQKRISNFSKEGFVQELNFPSIGEELNKLPKIELPKIPAATTTE